MPGVLILSLSGAQLGCDLDGRARQKQAEEAVLRKQMETNPPSPVVLEQLRQTAQDFLAEHNPEVTVQGFTFTELTPNLFLIGANVTDRVQGNVYVKQLSAERLRDADWGEDGEVKETGDFLWVIDYLDAARMDALARRHGIAGEIDQVRGHNNGTSTGWGQHTWLDDYLLWHFLFNRPSPMGYRYGIPGFSAMAPGFRFYAPNRPFNGDDINPYRQAAAATGGRSAVFLNGAAWNPPRSADVSHMTGQAYGISGAGGFVMGKTGLGGVPRGGFGATGHAVSAGS
ncbi:MAG TPA: hypothetical protein VFF76_06555 [Holophagaceae bacterium]|nr:hypothetical protein [Holophagaceae bacterium]